MKQVQLKMLELDNRVADINDRESFLVKMVQKLEAKKATVEEEEDGPTSKLVGLEGPAPPRKSISPSSSLSWTSILFSDFINW